MRALIPLLLLSGALFGQPFEKAMITEVLLDGPFGVEVTNRDHSATDLTGHVLHISWETSSGVSTTAFAFPAGVTLDEGDAIVITGQGSLTGPSLAPVLRGLTSVPPATGSAIAISLVDASGARVDDVLISSDLMTPVPSAVENAAVGTTGAPAFSGFVARSANTVRVERLGGLDSDGGSDWTEEIRVAPYNVSHRFGRAKINSGGRGFDPRPAPTVVISEIHAQGSAVGNFCEIHNRGTSAVTLDGWFFMISETQGSEFSTIEPFAAGTIIQPGEYVVVGDTATIPDGFIPTQIGGSPTQYIALMGEDFPWDEEEEFSVALYTGEGQLADTCKCTHRGDSHYAHNFPRAPGHWADFHGHGRRGVNSITAAGYEGVARVSTFQDTDTGHDWLPVIERSLGGPNFGFLTANTNASYPFFASNVGLADRWDVQVFQPEGIDALTMIVNAGSQYAGASVMVFVGVDPETLSVHGGGPIGGLTGGALGAPSLTGSLLLSAPLLPLDERGMGLIPEAPLPDPLPELEAICVLMPAPSAGGVLSPVPLRTYVLGFPGEEHGHHP